MSKAKGIDVSKYQDDPNTVRTIDWSKPLTQGVVFVIHRAANGSSIDRDFVRNWRASRKYPYILGAYGWLDYRTTADTPEAQASAFIGAMRVVGEWGDMPTLWADFEHPGSSWPALPGRLACLDMLKRYVDTLKNSGSGKRVGLYTNLAMLMYLTSENGVRVDLPKWLRDLEIWIAAWPSVPAGERLEDFLERTNWTPNLLGQWARHTIHQAGTPPYGAAMGMESDDIDFDVFNGTLEDLLAWCGLSELPEEPPVADNPYKSFAMGQYVSHENQLTNPAMKFVIADAGNYITGPNPRLAPIEAKAAEMGAHYFILWDLDITWYEDGQYTPTPNMTEYWPKPESDIPLIQFKDAIKNRSPKLVFVRIMDIAMSNGKPHDPDYLNSAVREFCNRASDWLWKTKKTMMVVQSSYDAYIQPYAPHIYDWCGYWDSCIEQATKKASDLDESYPKAEDKPRYHIGEYEPGKSRWRFWFYFDGASTDLYLFNGPPAALAAFLGEEAPDPIDATPPAKPTGLAAVVNEDRSVTLTWQATQDNVGVAEHLIIRDGYQIGVSAGIVYAYTDSPATGEHTYAVRARDAGGNLSPLSDPVVVAIPADNPETPVDLTAVLSALAGIGATLAEIQAVQAAQGIEISEMRGHFS